MYDCKNISEDLGFNSVREFGFFKKVKECYWIKATTRLLGNRFLLNKVFSFIRYVMLTICFSCRLENLSKVLHLIIANCILTEKLYLFVSLSTNMYLIHICFPL